MNKEEDAMVFIFGMMFGVMISTIFILLFIYPEDNTCKTITGYETRQCTIYSDGTETCEVVGRG